MNANEQKAVLGAVAMLCEAFNKTPSKATFEAYKIGLEGMSAEEINLAANRALANCRFMPPPVELREMLGGKSQDRAAKAWLAFENAVRRYGYTKSVCFDDPCIHATVRALGGWEACCDLPAHEFDAFLPKRFQETYASLARVGFSAEHGGPLVGWFDRQNGINGFDPQKLIHVETGIPALPAQKHSPSIGQSKRPMDIPRVELKKA